MRYLMLATILLAGCVTTSEVVPMANGQYLLTGRASGGMNAGKGAARKAADYCATLGKAPTIVSTDFHGAASVGGESTAFVFTCN